MRKVHFLIALFVVVLDRLAKLVVEHKIPLHDGIQIIPGFFRLTHLENRGAAFGLFADSPSPWKIGALVLFSVIALVVVSALLWKNSHTISITGIGLSLILGGAARQSLGPPYCRPRHGLSSLLRRLATSGQPSTSPIARSSWGRRCWLRDCVYESARRRKIAGSRSSCTTS